MINQTRFVIAVRDLESSARFYRDVLGFSVHECGDDGWRFFVRDECEIMAGECPDAIPPENLGDHSYFAYLVVENATSYYAQVVEQGVKIIKELRDEPWDMREFGIRTVDGHRIMFGEEITK